jgi:hypothetical protein
LKAASQASSKQKNLAGVDLDLVLNAEEDEGNAEVSYYDSIEEADGHVIGNGGQVCWVEAFLMFFLMCRCE